LSLHPKLVHFALIAYLGLIFIASSIPGEEIPKIGFEFSDKLIHAIVYLILFLLFFYSLKYQSKSVKLRDNALTFAGLFSALYGISDEIHQLFVPMRSCEIEDWFADVAGIIFGMLIIKLAVEKRSMPTITFLLIAFMFSCNTSDTSSGRRNDTLSVTVEKAECWTDHMPVVNDRGTRLGFEIVIRPGNQSDTLIVEKFLVARTDNDFLEKPFEIRSDLSSDGSKVLIVIQARETKYFTDTFQENETVQFKLTLSNGKGSKKTLTTSKIKPYKVY